MSPVATQTMGLETISLDAILAGNYSLHSVATKPDGPRSRRSRKLCPDTPYADSEGKGVRMRKVAGFIGAIVVLIIVFASINHHSARTVTQSTGKLADARNSGNSGTVNSSTTTTTPTTTSSTSSTTTTTTTPLTYENSAEAMSYPLLTKDPAALGGRVITLKAQVFQYDSVTTTAHFLANVSEDQYGVWSGIVWFDVNPAVAAHVCQNSVIQIWGPIIGAHTYITTSEGTNTVPEVRARYITVLSGGC